MKDDSIDFGRFIELRKRYLDCVDARVRAYDNYCKGRDFIVNVHHHYSRNDSLFFSKRDEFVLDIPSYVFEWIYESFNDFGALLVWFEKHIEKLEKDKKDI